MRKYSSGYFVIGVLAILGIFTIVVSVLGGLAIAGNSPNDIQYIGWCIAIGGSIQGLVLIGLSTIGTAILDGSIAQQLMVQYLMNIDSKTSSESIKTDSNLNNTNSAKTRSPKNWMDIEPLRPLKD